MRLKFFHNNNDCRIIKHFIDEISLKNSFQIKEGKSLADNKLLSWFEKRHKAKTLDLAHKQITKAIDTVTELEKAVTFFSKGEKAEAEKCIERLFFEEEEIDDLRRSVLEELTRGGIPPKDREDLMHLVKRLDVMADHVKDSARSVQVLTGSNIPTEIWDTNVSIAKALVECTVALHKCIEKLGSDLSEARVLSHKVDLIEDQVDKEYVKMKSLLIKYSREVDPASLIILKDLVEFMEHVADTCADTADYVRILASSEEKT